MRLPMGQYPAVFGVAFVHLVNAEGLLCGQHYLRSFESHPSEASRGVRMTPEAFGQYTYERESLEPWLRGESAVEN